VKNTTFPEKLMDVLSSKNHKDVITWFPEGKSFVILKSDQFTKQILSDFFDETNSKCFIEKRFCWSFKCLVGSAQDTAFYHDMFLRDQPQLCKQMRMNSISVNECDMSKTKKCSMSIISYDSYDKTALSTLHVGLDKAIFTTTAAKPEKTNDDSKALLSSFVSQNVQCSYKSQDIRNKPWLDEAFPVFNDERGIFRERVNMNAIMNLKPLVFRPAVNNHASLYHSRILDELYHRHILSNYNTAKL